MILTSEPSLKMTRSGICRGEVPLGLFTKHLSGDHCVSGRSKSQFLFKFQCFFNDFGFTAILGNEPVGDMSGRSPPWVCLPSISGATTAFLDALGVHIAGPGRSWESTLLDLDALGVQIADLDALGVQVAGSGRSGSPDCWIWTLWESRLLDLDALGVQIKKKT